MTRSRRTTKTLLAGALLVGTLTVAAAPAATTAAAAPTELFFSEYVEGSSNNKALEIYNGTGSAIDLGAGGYNLLVSFNGGSSTPTFNLSGTVAAGDVFVFTAATANAEILAQADQTTGAGLFNGNDAILLRRGTTVVDSIGQLGFDPGSQWGSGDASTADNTLRRKADVCAGDANETDVFDPAIEWDGFANNTVDGLGTHSTTCSDEPAAPVINEFVANHTGTDTYEFVEVKGAASSDLGEYTLIQVEGDGPLSVGTVDSVWPVGSTDAAGYWTTGFLTNLIENGTVTLLLVSDFSGSVGDDLDTNDDGVLDSQPWTAVVDSVGVSDGGGSDRVYGVPTLAPTFDGGTFTVGGASRIPDGTDTDTASDWVRNDFNGNGLPNLISTTLVGQAVNTPGAVNVVIEPTPGGDCGDPVVLIHQIQGSGSSFDPAFGGVQSVEAVITALAPGLNGLYVQEEAADQDADATTSEGIFVFLDSDPAAELVVGDVVRVTGTVGEYVTSGGASSQTQLTGGPIVTSCGTTATVPPTEVLFPLDDPGDLEAFEGMRVTLSQELAISEYFNYDRFNEVVVALPLDGDDRPYIPTAVVEPGPDAVELAAENARRRITVDDFRSTQNPDPAIHPGNGEVFDLANRFRGGDTITGIEGVIDDTFGLYRLQPTTYGTFTVTNERPAAPDAVGGDTRVASMNVLNYFLTVDTGPDICGPAQNQDCRGADSQEELDRQRAKIIAALTGLDSDVVGLIELENTTGVEPIDDLVNGPGGLNDVFGAGTYDYIDTGTIGTDAIRVGMIYRPDAVTPVGDPAILDSSVDPRFIDTLNRPVLAQAFEAPSGRRFTVAVNHLKSKGSDCNSVGDVDAGDGQGNCNGTRTAAAEALADWLATDPTGAGTTDALIIGDLNSYDKEDPITALVDAGYTDLIAEFGGEKAYGYLFGAEFGYLDHALASSGFAAAVTGATEWHINADEPDIFDYNVDFKAPAQQALYEPNAFRSSDHDPVVVGLDLTPPTIDVSVTPEVLSPPNHRYVDVEAMVTVADETDPAPSVRLVSVTSNEPDNGEDDGNTVDDIVIVDDDSFRLRAERSGVGEGRIYTITYEAEDAAGNVAIGVATVEVPLSRGR